MDTDYRNAYLDGYVKGVIALQIRSLRKQLKLSQKEFAEKTHKTQSVISRLEDTEYGAVTVNTLLDIAKALDIALEVRFTSYPAILTADVSPQAFIVANVFDSYSNAASSATQQVTPSLPPIGLRNPYWLIIQSSRTRVVPAGKTGAEG